MSAAWPLGAEFLAGAAVGMAAATILHLWRLSRAAVAQEAARTSQTESIAPVLKICREMKEVLERIQGDVNILSGKVQRLASEAAAAPSPPAPPVRRGFPAQQANEPPPRGGTAMAKASIQGSPGGVRDTNDDPVPDLGDGPNALLAGGDSGAWEGPAGAAQGPPPNAITVEARDDRIVSSSSYPAEAWLEVGPVPAEGRVTLNPAVKLTEYALQRLSTFFEWEAMRAGAAYQTVRPAVVRWDEGQRVGTLLSRGRARAR